VKGEKRGRRKKSNNTEYYEKDGVNHSLWYVYPTITFTQKEKGGGGRSKEGALNACISGGKEEPPSESEELMSPGGGGRNGKRNVDSI